MVAESLSSAFDIFKTKSPSLIGVDIASTSVKLIELSQTGKGTYRLERYAIEPLPKETVTDGNIVNLERSATRSSAVGSAWAAVTATSRCPFPPPW